MRSIIVTALLAALLAPAVSADRYVVSPGEGNEILFRSQAPLESFEGRTDRVRGTISVDWSDPAGSLKIRVAVDLAALDTGIDLRNRHMRENHLHTEEFPEAVFTADSLRGLPAGSGAPADTTSCTVIGEFSLHGETKKITVPVTIIPDAGGGLTVEARFEVNLADYGIPRPKFLFLKLDEVQKVRVRLAAAPEGKTK